MRELTIAKCDCPPPREVSGVRQPCATIAGWLTGIWSALARHAERPERVVPYY